jgi:uncharacterized repeat protein (TIGR03803 family)
LALDAQGNLYGTTGLGGAFGHGAVFKVTPEGNQSVLYSFTGGVDGDYPQGGLVLDARGNLYGTTTSGGLPRSCRMAGCGVVFAVTPDGTERVLHSFRGPNSDGKYPNGGMAIDAQGNLYGTTYRGGVNNYGTIFEITSNGAEKILYTFPGGPNGIPIGNVVGDARGNLFGIAGAGKGKIFEVTASGQEKTLYTFTTAKGARPAAGLAIDANGNLYGTTTVGGTYGFGTFFQLTP